MEKKSSKAPVPQLVVRFAMNPPSLYIGRGMGGCNFQSGCNGDAGCGEDCSCGSDQ